VQRSVCQSAMATGPLRSPLPTPLLTLTRTRGRPFYVKTTDPNTWAISLAWSQEVGMDVLGAGGVCTPYVGGVPRGGCRCGLRQERGLPNGFGRELTWPCRDAV